jgi:hypothetical protein
MLGLGDEQSHSKLSRTSQRSLLFEDPRRSRGARFRRQGQCSSGVGRESKEANSCIDWSLSHSGLDCHPRGRTPRDNWQLRLFHKDVGRGFRPMHSDPDQP